MPNFIIEKSSLDLHRKIPTIQLVAYRSECYFDNLYNDYSIKKPIELQTWSIKRKAQFLAGRIAIKSSFKQLDLKAAKVIEIGRGGEPLWPQGFSGCISHQDQFSIACLEKANNSIGLDIERLLDQEGQLNCEKTVLSVKDKKYIAQNSKQLTKQKLTTLIFSAKESFFKAAYKSVEALFDFDAVSIQSLDIKKQQLTFYCEVSLDAKIRKSDEFVVQFCFCQLRETEHVVCYCELS